MVSRLPGFLQPPEGIELNPARAILQRFQDDVTLARAGIELARGTAGLPAGLGLESISGTAGQLLLDAGVVRTRDQGIVLFHRAITQDKPSLRKVLRRVDEKAGRIKRRTPTPKEKIIRDALKAGQVTRVKGKITRFDPKVKSQLRKVERDEKREAAKRKRAFLRRIRRRV